eukprot:1885675-Lingulodinium_polyedra.AAC.1
MRGGERGGRGPYRRAVPTKRGSPTGRLEPKWLRGWALRGCCLGAARAPLGCRLGAAAGVLLGRRSGAA